MAIKSKQAAKDFNQDLVEKYAVAGIQGIDHQIVDLDITQLRFVYATMIESYLELYLEHFNR